MTDFRIFFFHQNKIFFYSTKLNGCNDPRSS